MKRLLLSATFVMAMAAGAVAATTGTLVTTLFQDDPDVRAFTGATDSDPNCLQVLSDGRLVWFESESAAGNNAEDALMLFDPNQSGAARFSVLASEAALAALVGASGSPDIFAEDCCLDGNDNIYLLGAQAKSGGDDYFVVKVPFSAGSFGIPTLIAGPGVVPLGIPPTEGFGAIDYDSANDRLILMISENVDEDSLTGIAGVYTLPNSPSGSPVQQLVSRVDMVVQLTPTPSAQSGDRATFEDLAVLPNGDIILPFNVRAGTQADAANDGDVLRVTAAGTPSLFIDALTLRSDVVTSFGLTTMFIEYNAARDAVALLEEFTSFSDRNVIAEFSTAGAFQRIVADNENLLQNTGTPANDFRIFSRAFDSGPDGAYYVFTGRDNESCQKIEVNAVVPNAAHHWNLY